MLGIVSNQMIDKSSIRTMLLSLGFKEDINSFISYNSWAAVCGLEMFEGKAVSVVSDSDLYNLQELSSLVDDKLQNNAHLICLLYLKYGLLFFEKLRGTFSICIIDKKKQKFFVVTDRFGIKPIVYYLNENLFIFGPRIKVIQSVLQSKIDEIDYEAVVDYINLSAIPTPKTIFKKVKKLPPGHFLVINKDENSPQIHKYYDIEYSEKKSGEEYFLSELPLSIEESVRTILEYEFSRGSSVGAFLSGGTDSSTVTGMIKKLNGHVKTFSIGFDEPGYNELKYARITSKYFSSEHYEYIVTPDDVLKALDIILDVYDEPFGNASGVPTYFCAFLAKKHGVNALFAGDGGDEIFGGNERYAANNMFSLYHKIPSILRERLLEPGISKLPSAIPFVEKGKKYIRRANIPQPDRFYSYNPVTVFGKEEIFSSEALKYLNGYDPLVWARNLYNDVKAVSDLNRLLYIDMKFTITDNDIRKVTAMSEKAGVRVCYPLLDHNLVDFAATIPAHLKVNGTKLRYIFKKALHGFLPVEVIKKKKHGFGLPIGVWIRTKKNISSFVREILLSPDCNIKPFFREGFIKDIFKLHAATNATFYGDIIWFLLIFELWNKKRRYNGS